MPDPDIVLDAARTLERSMNNLGERIVALRRYGRINRVLVTVVGALTALQFGLIGWNIQIARTAYHASSQARFNAATARQRCLSGNETLGAIRNSWNFVISLSPPPPPNSQAQTNLTKFQHYLDTQFQPRSC